MLEGEAQHEHVGAERIAEQRGSACAWRRRNARCSSPAASRIAFFSRSTGSEKSADRAKSPGMISAVLATKMVWLFADGRKHLLGAGHDEVAAEHEVGLAGRDADRVDLVRRPGDADMAEHGAALLGEAGHVDHAAALAFEMRGHAEDGADRDDAGAADAVDDRRPAARRAERRPAPARRASGSLAPATPSALRILAPCTVTKDGQKPLTQEKSLLQLDWSMRRLRPNSVSTGCTDTQFDCTPQSPQPSQTSSLMITRLSGSG